MSTAEAEEDPGRPDVAKCAHVLGFSQTADWFMAPVFRGFLPNPVQPPEAGAIFESIVDGNKWQLQWTNGAGRVRASWQATPILEAIEIVADSHPDVVAGATTRVRSCGHFVDGIGHLSNGQMLSGAATAAVDAGLFYGTSTGTARNTNPPGDIPAENNNGQPARRGTPAQDATCEETVSKRNIGARPGRAPLTGRPGRISRQHRRRRPLIIVANAINMS